MNLKVERKELFPSGVKIMQSDLTHYTYITHYTSCPLHILNSRQRPTAFRHVKLRFNNETMSLVLNWTCATRVFRELYDSHVDNHLPSARCKVLNPCPPPKAVFKPGSFHVNSHTFIHYSSGI